MYGRIHEDLGTRLTPPSRKRTVFRGALMIMQVDPVVMSKPTFKRAERVADQLRIEVADILAKKIKRSSTSCSDIH